jgi:hypothetical protein
VIQTEPHCTATLLYRSPTILVDWSHLALPVPALLRYTRLLISLPNPHLYLLAFRKDANRRPLTHLVDCRIDSNKRTERDVRCYQKSLCLARRSDARFSSRPPFFLIFFGPAEDSSRPSSPVSAPTPAAPAPPAPARGSAQKSRGGPAARGGKYYARGGAKSGARDEGTGNLNQNGIEDAPQDKKCE